MGKSAYINARIEPGLKTEAEEVLQTIGLSTSDAITLFYRQIVLRRGLPFDVRIPNQQTVAAFAELEAGGGEVVEGSTENAFDEIIDGDHHRRG